MALEMIDELADWGLRPPVLTADAGYGQVAEFRQGLSERGIQYIVATTSTTTAQPGDATPVAVAYAGMGKYPAPKYPGPAHSVKDLAIAHGATAANLVRWRARLPDRIDPDKPVGELSGHFFALRVRPAGRPIPRPGLECGDPQTALGQRRSRLAGAGADLEDSITRLHTDRHHQPVEQLGRIVRPRP